MKKKLTVRTLSFIMAAGLLLIVVPFVAIASGSEKPEPGKRGDFRLLKEFYAVTQVTLEEDMASNPKVSAECSSAESYQWQAYSRGQERYADLPNYVGSDLSISVSFARQYNYGNGESYFRCLATDSDGNLLISDVLTVVLPKPQVKETEETQTEETGATISTIELLEPTQPGETDPTQPTTGETAGPDETTTAPEGTTTEPEGTTTMPEGTTTEAEGTTTEATASPTEPTTEPTKPVADNGEKGEPDDDTIEGKLLKPLTEDQKDDGEEEDSEPITAMFLRSLAEPTRDATKDYTVVYYVEKADSEGFEYFRTESSPETAVPGTGIDYTNAHKLYTGTDAGKNAYFELDSSSPTVYPTDSNVVAIKYKRKRYTFKFNNTSGSTVVIKDKYNKTHRIGINASYEFNAKYGENLIGLWPTNDMFTTLPYAILGEYCYESATEDMQYGYNTYYNPPQKLDSEFLSASHKQTYDMNFKYYVPGIIFLQPCSLSFYFQNEDGTYNNSPDFVKRGNNTIYNDNNLPSYSGFSSGTPIIDNGNTGRVYYSRNQYTLTYIANGGTPPPAPEQVYFDKVLTAEKYNKSTTRDGYIFRGWFYDEGFNNPVGWDVDKMPTRSVTVYAKWNSASVPHTITFNNTGEEQKTLTFGQSLEGQIPNSPSPDAAHATGYSFGGWYSDSGLTNSYTFPGTMPNDDIVVYAKWNPIPHTITFINTGESMATVNYGATLDGTVIPANPAPDAAHATGYSFGGWYGNENLTGNPYEFPSTMPDEDIVVFAKWNLKTFTVHFYKVLTDNDTNFANPVFSYNDKINDGYIASGYEERDGYFFKGWLYTNETVTEAAPFVFYDGSNADEATCITSETYIFGDWKEKYTVTFDLANGEATTVKTVENGTAIAKEDAPTQPEKDYFSFNGWWYEVTIDDVTTEVPFTFEDTQNNVAGTLVTGNMNVYAKWVKNQITLNIQNMNLRDNIFKVTGTGVNLDVVVPGGLTVPVMITVRQLPFGEYTVSSCNWDYRNNYAFVYPDSGTKVDASAANPTAEGSQLTYFVTANGTSKNLHWLGGDLRTNLTPATAG